MRNVLLGVRWFAVPAALFFVFALVTDQLFNLAFAVLLVAVAVVVVVGVVDLAVRRR